MRAVVALLLVLLLPLGAEAQSRAVLPGELALSVSVEGDATPLVGEMIIVTIRGEYRRHVTRETLVQPDLDGFNWSQLGVDTWRDERVDGRPVKVFLRRMALFPRRPGPLSIGAFHHDLTLTDETTAWFEHRVSADPVTISVDPAPPTDDWWLPVRRLRISDEWSNAPDRLAPGEGVLRIVRVEALGATPEMMPPMPELRSPSARIFPHPERRLVQLTPEGPETIAFWRWTIQPGDGPSAILEPLTVTYFDTASREMRRATITAQRVAHDAPAPVEARPADRSVERAPAEVRLPGAALALLAVGVAVIGVGAGGVGRRADLRAALRRLPVLDGHVRRLRRAARTGDAAAMRRALVALAQRDPEAVRFRAAIAALDRGIFGPRGSAVDLTSIMKTALHR